MTDQTATDDLEVESDGAGDSDEESEGRRKSGRVAGKKVVLFYVLPVLLIAIAGAGVYLSGLANGLLGIETGEGQLLAEEWEGPAVYYDLPEMLVNLNTSGRRSGFLKISVSLEVASEDDLEHIEKVLPRIIDNFQVYLRELRVEDLRGSAGLQRLREELLMRVSNAAKPAVVRDVLFREMLVQ
jgi:flagellar FliL protein